jgi:hypothetical protein
MAKTIAISKLCCPVCAELLKVLNIMDVGPRGCHPHIAAADLPAWLPLDVVEEMVVRFQNLLCPAIAVMLSYMDEPQGKPRGPSLDSTSAFSTATDESADYMPTLEPQNPTT